MKKKPFLTRMRMFIAAGSFVGLIGGWAMLAQAGEPISTPTLSATSATTTTAQIEQVPTQSTGFGNTTGAASTTTRTTTRPRLRTGGS